MTIDIDLKDSKLDRKTKSSEPNQRSKEPNIKKNSKQRKSTLKPILPDKKKKRRK